MFHLLTNFIGMFDFQKTLQLFSFEMKHLELCFVATLLALIIISWLGYYGMGKLFPSKNEQKAEDPENKVDESKIPLSVNYHLTRKCNYECKFCFHQAKTSSHLPIEEAKKGLKMLVEAGMRKINFAGGEPFIVERGRYLGELVRFCKKDLSMESVTIVSNGSLIKESWFEEFGKYLDILAISCDSDDPDTLWKIGRYAKRTDHLNQLRFIHDMCEKYDVMFKINTVVCSVNWRENLSDLIETLDPVRWKVFQCLLIEG